MGESCLLVRVEPRGIEVDQRQRFAFRFFSYLFILLLKHLFQSTHYFFELFSSNPVNKKSIYSFHMFTEMFSKSTKISTMNIRWLVLLTHFFTWSNFFVLYLNTMRLSGSVSSAVNRRETLKFRSIKSLLQLTRWVPTELGASPELPHPDPTLAFQCHSPSFWGCKLQFILSIPKIKVMIYYGFFRQEELGDRPWQTPRKSEAVSYTGGRWSALGMWILSFLTVSCLRSYLTTSLSNGLKASDLFWNYAMFNKSAYSEFYRKIYKYLKAPGDQGTLGIKSGSPSNFWYGCEPLILPFEV